MTNFDLSPDEFLRLQREISSNFGKCQILPMRPASIVKVVLEVYLVIDMAGEVVGVFSSRHFAESTIYAMGRLPDEFLVQKHEVKGYES
jgi:hypothetical protein